MLVGNVLEEASLCWKENWEFRLEKWLAEGID